MEKKETVREEKEAPDDEVTSTCHLQRPSLPAP